MSEPKRNAYQTSKKLKEEMERNKFIFAIVKCLFIFLQKGMNSSYTLLHEKSNPRLNTKAFLSHGKNKTKKKLLNEKMKLKNSLLKL